ncbi:hypothetical protein SRHO_G00148570 [Serrasalmus rhombeus]
MLLYNNNSISATPEAFLFTPKVLMYVEYRLLLWPVQPEVISSIRTSNVRLQRHHHHQQQQQQRPTTATWSIAHNHTGVTLGSAECAGRPEAMRLVHSTEKQAFSFKKCSAFQFVKRKVRRWMRNPKVSVEKSQTKGFLSPCPKCQDGQDLWYTHFPTTYACCPYSPGGYYLPHPPSPLCQPCTAGSRDKNKTCKVRKWKMLSRHHSDGKAKEVEPEGQVICPWAMSPLLGNPVLLECCVCSGPFITYSSEEAWQPRQRTQAMDLYYHGDADPDYSCSSDTSNLRHAKDALILGVEKMEVGRAASEVSEAEPVKKSSHQNTASSSLGSVFEDVLEESETGTGSVSTSSTVF